MGSVIFTQSRKLTSKSTVRINIWRLISNKTLYIINFKFKLLKFLFNEIKFCSQTTHLLTCLHPDVELSTISETIFIELDFQTTNQMKIVSKFTFRLFYWIHRSPKDTAYSKFFVSLLLFYKIWFNKIIILGHSVLKKENRIRWAAESFVISNSLQALMETTIFHVFSRTTHIPLFFMSQYTSKNFRVILETACLLTNHPLCIISQHLPF